MKKSRNKFVFPAAGMIMVSLACSSISQILATPTPVPTNTPSPTITPTATPSVTPTVPSPTATPDLCAPENIPSEVEKVNDYMTEFESASILAANASREQLGDPIANLQGIQQEADAHQVPPCLTDLKKH